MLKVMKLFVLIFVLLLFSWTNSLTILGNDLYQLPQLIEPSSISIDHEHIYIPEQTSIYIYNLKDLTLNKKIGKRGEGPQEFLLNVVNGFEELILDVSTQNLLINSMGKISFYTKDKLSFLKEIKSRSRSREFKILGQGFAGQAMVVDNGIQYRAVCIYDSELGKVKDVYRVKHHFQINEGLKVFYSTVKFLTWDNKLFIAWEPDFIIRVYDDMGKSLYVIKLDYERSKIESQFKEKTVKYLKTGKKYKRLFELLDIKVHFPAKFPAIKNILIDNGKIYVTTFKMVGEKTECYILDKKGKLLRKLFLPIIGSEETEEFLPYPYTIYNGKHYQLVNKDDQWSLKISKF